MDNKTVKSRKRGRPLKNQEEFQDTKEALIRAGLEVITEKGYVSSSIDEILKKVSVPKGSYYYYFSSKEEFGRILIENYISFFAHKIEKSLKNENLTPLQRIESFVDSAAKGIEKYNFTRGCLIGNMGQEVESLPEAFRAQIKEGFELWQSLIEACLIEAKQKGEIPKSADCNYLSSVFWSNWEGAVMRARLDKSSAPLYNCLNFFLAGIQIT